MRGRADTKDKNRGSRGASFEFEVGGRGDKGSAETKRSKRLAA